MLSGYRLEVVVSREKNKEMDGERKAIPQRCRSRIEDVCRRAQRGAAQKIDELIVDDMKDRRIGQNMNVAKDSLRLNFDGAENEEHMRNIGGASWVALTGEALGICPYELLGAGSR